MGAPPCIWTFLISLGENGVFSILLFHDGQHVVHLAETLLEDCHDFLRVHGEERLR
jgi:hypothetical protein